MTPTKLFAAGPQPHFVRVCRAAANLTTINCWNYGIFPVSGTTSTPKRSNHRDLNSVDLGLRKQFRTGATRTWRDLNLILT